MSQEEGKRLLAKLMKNGGRYRCPRKGRYRVAKLIEKYGRKGNMMKWKEQLNGDCPKRDSRCTSAATCAARPAEGGAMRCCTQEFRAHICYMTVTNRALIVTELF